METKITEIAERIFRLSTAIEHPGSPDGFTFNQFLILGDEPLMFHAGLRRMFPTNREALAKLLAPGQLRWIAFGHFEADECGSLNEWLAAEPHATAAHGRIGCRVSLNDFADRAPRVLADGETIDLGGKRVRYIDTPHTPHAWDAGLLFEETTQTLMCGDLFTQFGREAQTGADLLGPASHAEDIMQYSCLSPGMGATIRRLADLAPKTLALMHGPAFSGDCAGALRGLADDYDRRARQASSSASQ